MHHRSVAVTGSVWFRIARNPDDDSSLPYLLSVPLGPAPLVLKAKDTWPRTAKVYCHRGDWPETPEIVEETAVRSCVRRGVAIDLVLDRPRENRSQFVVTTLKGGREGIFWQTARTPRKTRRTSLTAASSSDLASSQPRVGQRSSSRTAGPTCSV